MSDNKQIGHFMIGAGAIIEHPTKNQILITKRKNTVHENNKWEFVYGRIDNSEGIIPGLKREVFEETGLANISIKKAIRFWNFFRGEKKPENEICGITFICQSDTDEVVLNHEHETYQWIEPEKALDKIYVPGIKMDLEIYLKHQKLQNLGIYLSDSKQDSFFYL